MVESKAYKKDFENRVGDDKVSNDWFATRDWIACGEKFVATRSSSVKSISMRSVIRPAQRTGETAR